MRTLADSHADQPGPTRDSFRLSERVPGQAFARREVVAVTVVAMKDRPHLAHVPIVLVSASTHRARIAEGREKGAADFVNKPFSAAELRAKVEEVLAA